MATLHHTLLRPDAEPTSHGTLVLHGILGSGPNLRSLAQALQRRVSPRATYVLVDLRNHGRSQGFAPPHTLDACAADLSALVDTLDFPVREVIGHSFGGKVALTFAHARGDLDRLVMLDSAPGARRGRKGSEDTLEVLDMLERLPPSFSRRDTFVTHVTEAGFSKMLAEWLAMSLARTADGFRFGLDLEAIRALLDDYFARDLWPLLEALACRVELVIGGRSRVYDTEAIARARALEAKTVGRARVHVIDNAGHWLHMEALDEVVQALTP